MLAEELRLQGEGELLQPGDVRCLPDEGLQLRGDVLLKREEEKRLLAAGLPRKDDVLLSLAGERSLVGGPSRFKPEESDLLKFVGGKSWQPDVEERGSSLHEEGDST